MQKDEKSCKPYPTGDVKRAAAWLHLMGANVLALDGKRPKGEWARWQREPQRTADAEALPWADASGVGIVSGPGGWRCFDIDGCTTWAPIERLCDALGVPHNYRWIVRSGSGAGWHLWLRCPDADAFPNKIDRPAKRSGAFDHLELRWAEHQTAAPPSMHPSGSRYTFANGAPDGPPIERTAEQVEAALDAVTRPKPTKTPKRARKERSASLTGEVNVEDVRAALEHIPPRPDYPDWIKIIAAVQDGTPDDSTAEALLQDWSPEETPGEYAKKLASGLDQISVGTLFFIAAQHGYQIPKRTPKKRGGFTVEDFAAALDGLDGRAAERKATALLEKVATLGRAGISRCRDLLEDHGARARRVRSFESDAKAVKKEQESEAPSADEGNTPQNLKHGAVTAWLVEQVNERDHFALDRSGALYYYERGRYRAGGERYLDQRIKAILDKEGLEEEFTRYRCDEVRHRVVTDAPRLWETPPDDRINLLNGILNLETGEIEAHTPDWLSTRQVQIKHDPEAEGTAWRDFFAAVLPSDAGVELGYQLAARLITPAFGRRKAYYLHGGPSTGKSTLIRNLVSGIIGEECVTHITLQDLDSDSFARADLFGRMLNVCADLPARPLEGVSVFKQITGGDRMNAQRKYKDRFNFTPHCHLLFSGNAPLTAPMAGDAFWDRWVVIPFENTFSKGEGNYTPRGEMDASLQDPEELSALLNKVLDVLLDVRENGVTVSDSMARALDAMRRQPDNQPAAHVGDGAPRKNSDTPEHPPKIQPARVSDTPTRSKGALETENSSIERGGSSLKDFEKKRKLDTGGVCPKESSFKSSEPDEKRLQHVLEKFGSGMRVETPDGLGKVTEISHSGPHIVVLLDDEIGSRPYDPDDVEPVTAPF